MKPLPYCAAVLAWALGASPCGAKVLPEMTTLEAYVEFVHQTAGEATDAAEEFGRYKSTVAGVASVRFFEDTHEDQDFDEIVQFILRSTSRFCTAFRPTAVTRRELDGMTLLRTSVRCAMMGVELHGEELIIADAARYHNYSIGGPAQNREKISEIATRMFDALVAAYH
jgi:hypothetical protein